ncbi:hypothetical protein HDE_00459 [Halotydeus destructor]|nr:hypothetical protein HDE_00459 [Halotydeus destructor]
MGSPRLEEMFAAIHVQEVISDSDTESYFSDTESYISMEDDEYTVYGSTPTAEEVAYAYQFSEDVSNHEWTYEERLGSYQGRTWYGKPMPQEMAEAGFIFYRSYDHWRESTVVCQHCGKWDTWTPSYDLDPIVRHAQLDLLCTFIQNKIL